MRRGVVPIQIHREIEHQGRYLQLCQACQIINGKHDLLTLE